MSEQTDPRVVELERRRAKIDRIREKIALLHVELAREVEAITPLEIKLGINLLEEDDREAEVNQNDIDIMAESPLGTEGAGSIAGLTTDELRHVQIIESQRLSKQPTD